MTTTATEVSLLCDRKAMLDAFSLAASVAPSRSPKPILQCIKLEADPEAGSSLLASDLDVSLRVRVGGVKCDEPGAVILPTQRFGAILRSTEDADISLAASKDKLTVKTLRSKFTLSTEDPDLFPDVPSFESASYLSIAASDLRRLIRRAAFATDPESMRYALGGCLVVLEASGESMVFVGTDGRRLAKATALCRWEGQPTEIGQIVIPVKAMKLIDRVLASADDDEPIHLAFVKNQAVLVRTPTATIHSRLVEGRYPRWQDVFPAEHKVRVETEAGPLLRAVEQASIVTSDESRGVDFAFADGVLKLASESADAGQSDVELPITYAGDPPTITFDCRYLVDALKTLDADAPVALDLIDGKAAMVLRVEPGFSYVLMPLTRER
ncbi:MAG: DNA polymerase III subunit beta [Phycisphaerales bacterium]